MVRTVRKIELDPLFKRIHQQLRVFMNKFVTKILQRLKPLTLGDQGSYVATYCIVCHGGRPRGESAKPRKGSSLNRRTHCSQDVPDEIEHGSNVAKEATDVVGQEL